MNQIVLSKKNSRVITKSLVTDILLLGVIYMLPAISHMLAFPLYLLDPMRIVIFASILLSCNKYNSYLLAATIPMFSYFVGGHPIFLKSVIIAAELLVNVMLFWFLLKKWRNMFLITFSSIILAKVVYYALKSSFIQIGWLQMDLVDTSLTLQLMVAVAISIVMILVFKLFHNESFSDNVCKN